MVGTHADSLIAEAVKKGIAGFDHELAWQAVLKDATVPPKDDRTTQYDDREEVSDCFPMVNGWCSHCRSSLVR